MDVNLQVQRGEFVFVVGPSGAGKSTFVRLLYREALPTRGRVVVDGQDVVRIPRRHLHILRRKVGVVFQDFRLLPGKTVFENVAFAMFVVEANRRDIRRRTVEVLEQVGLLDKLKSFPHELSGGEQQRVALARAIVNRPAMVVADEPTGNLDPRTSWEIIRLLDGINQGGTTVIVATHDQPVVNALQRRVVHLQKGRVVADREKGMYAIEG